MASRPENLFGLFSDISRLAGVGPKSVKALETLGITHPRDLLFWLPQSGISRRFCQRIVEAAPAEVIVISVEVQRHYPGRTRSAPYRILVNDGEHEFTLIFFHASSKWLMQQLPEGSQRVVSGKVEMFDQRLQIVHPDYVLPADQAAEIPEFEPIYRLASGLTTRLFSKVAQELLTTLPKLAEWIDPALKAREKWPDWGDALHVGHRPLKASELDLNHPARRRLAYDELFAHQLTLALARARTRRTLGRETRGDGRLQQLVLASLPYQPTGAQQRSMAEISADLAAPIRMNRLLQGDVGAGKTLVAFLSLLVAIEAGGQGVMMAPTEILARQHFDALMPLAETVGVKLEILTGRDKGVSRREKLAKLSAGDIGILVGTHAVFQKDVHFHDLRLAIVDEQHRFGVAQRMELGAKGAAVDVLVMTATPIPRSLALAQYGDMDVSVLDEKPPGRQPIKTASISTTRLDEVVARLRAAISQGAQAYWVCPLVEESEFMDMTAAQERFKYLRAALGDGVVGLVHGQLSPAEKDAAMAAFNAGDTKLLVATTVIEVGVDVPNATIMVIERAEHFGLAQLHQLRGRVGRGQGASTCLLMYQAPLSASGEKRLNVMRDTEDGFEISQADLEMRGAGDVLGTAQSGLPRFWVADLEHQSGLMALAQQDARLLLEQDPELTSPRGVAARELLWLMRQDQAIRLISVG